MNILRLKIRHNYTTTFTHNILDMYVKRTMKALTLCNVHQKNTININKNDLEYAHDETLIHLTKNQADLLYAYIDENINQVATYIDQLSNQITINLLSNMLLGINWPNYRYMEEKDRCQLIWLIQSQAKKSGLSVIDHAGDVVDTTIDSLQQTLREISCHNYSRFTKHI